MGITVTGISFTGLKNAGSCTVNPNATGSSPKVVWNSSAAEGNVISQAFTAENLVTYSQEGDENGFAESFFSSGTVQNVNDASASFTFWLIPQAFAGSEAVLRISYTMSGKAEYMDLALGDILKSVTWGAGELRTYTIKLDNVNVMIEDQVNIPEDGSATADNGYEGSTKEDVTITNTGTTPVYIRVAIVGQWLDSNNNPVFGFTDKLNQLYQVESWYQDQFVKPDPGVQGKFVGLPGYKGASTFKASEDDPTVGWQLCTDRYYYYTDVVYPDATTSELFESYTVMQIPDAQLGGIPVDQRTMHFELEIAAQAVSAVKTDGVEGSLYSWKEAWTRTSASGKTPVEK